MHPPVPPPQPWRAATPSRLMAQRTFHFLQRASRTTAAGARVYVAGRHTAAVRYTWLAVAVRGAAEDATPTVRSSTASTSSSLRSFAAGRLAAVGAASVARRYASTGRRPTFSEVAEALEVLGVSVDEDAKTLKAKYRELVKQNHPDAGGDAATMARVTVAYDRLSSLTNREREEFKVQRRAFGGGSAGGAARRYRPGPPGGFTHAAPGGPFDARTANMYGQYYQQDPNSAYAQAHGGGRGQQGYWTQFRHRGRDNSSGSGSFTDSPFTSSNPFSMYAAAQRARVVPPGALLLRGLVAYLILSSIFLVAYRSYRDWRHEDGWRMSESLARHEQMEEMHRIRQEMNERARLLLQRGGDDAAAATALYGSRQHVGESPEARALEYARQRRIQMMQEQQESATAAAPELRGWPRIDEDKGRIIRRAQDPPGVVFFEPRKEDTRRRQIDNQRRGSGFVRRGTSEASGAGADGTAAAATAATAASAPPPPPSPLTSPSSSSGVSLPPEVNVGSIVATPVGSEQEAQAVMRNIFGGLRKSAS